MTAAIDLLDREGLAALSMRKLADELGAGAASLYWHVGSKDGLLDLVMDEIIGEGNVPDPEPDRWQEQLKQVARDQRAGILRHPWVVRVSIGRIPMGPHACATPSASWPSCAPAASPRAWPSRDICC